MLRKIKSDYILQITSYRFLLPVISAILLVLAYPKLNLEFLAWVALVPLFFTIENKEIKERFIRGYIFGIIFFAGILWWLVNVSIPGMIVLVLLLSIAPALFCALIPKTEDRGLLTIVFVPAAWVLTEYLRTHLFTGFPWALLAYSQSLNLPIIQIADITGPYGVSFLVVLVNYCIFKAIKKGPKKILSFRDLFFGWTYILLFAMAVYLVSFVYGYNRLRAPEAPDALKVSVIQGNIPQEMKWDARYKYVIVDKYRALTKDSLKENPRFVIWPETSIPGYIDEEDIMGRIRKLAKENNIFLLVGALRQEAEKIYNSAVLISNEGNIASYYDKIHLVPMGEFIPFSDSFGWVRNFINKPIGHFNRGNEFTVFRFTLKDTILRPDRIQRAIRFYKFSTLVCFEDIFPDLCRRFVKNGAEFLVNMTNDAWFGNTRAPYQHAQGSIFRAVENRVPVIRAANTGVSCIIDKKGRVIATVRDKKKETFISGYTVAVIVPGYYKTIYTKFGDVFSWIMIIFAFGSILYSKVRRLREK